MNSIPTPVEIVCQTEYQDIYRIKPYVLLVVDKFTLGEVVHNCSNHLSQYTRPYSKGTESGLRVSKKNNNKVYYYDFVANVTTPNNYRFKLKTSGDAFNGNWIEFNNLLLDCNEIVQSYYEPLEERNN